MILPNYCPNCGSRAVKLKGWSIGYECGVHAWIDGTGSGVSKPTPQCETLRIANEISFRCDELNTPAEEDAS